LALGKKRELSVPYSEEQIEKLEREYIEVCKGLQDLVQHTVVAGQESRHSGVKEHLLHGAARRINVIKRSIENIFTEFPPSTSRPIERDKLYDVQINLHAYVMNLFGIFDNWAWAFVFRHDLLEQVGGKHGVGLFHKNTAKHCPEPLRNYLSSNTIADWHEKYLKSFRDALAHRIPLYIPPAEFTPEEGEHYNQLESRKLDLIRGMRWQELDELYDEQAQIGRPSFVFLHSYEEEAPKPILFHPQLLCDGLAIVEFGSLYLEHWESVA
jgi:hypothetical protein